MWTGRHARSCCQTCLPGCTHTQYSCCHSSLLPCPQISRLPAHALHLLPIQTFPMLCNMDSCFLQFWTVLWTFVLGWWQAWFACHAVATPMTVPAFLWTNRHIAFLGLPLPHTPHHTPPPFLFIPKLFHFCIFVRHSFFMVGNCLTVIGVDQDSLDRHAPFIVTIVCDSMCIVPSFGVQAPPSHQLWNVYLPIPLHTSSCAGLSSLNLWILLLTLTPGMPHPVLCCGPLSSMPTDKTCVAHVCGTGERRQGQTEEGTWCFEHVGRWLSLPKLGQDREPPPVPPSPLPHLYLLTHLVLCLSRQTRQFGKEQDCFWMEMGILPCISRTGTLTLRVSWFFIVGMAAIRHSSSSLSSPILSPVFFPFFFWLVWHFKVMSL